MAAPDRPSLARKHTRTTETHREEGLDEGIVMNIDGEVFEARVGDMTPELTRELRAACGMGFMTLMNTCGTDPDIDVVSSFVWLARRIRGTASPPTSRARRVTSSSPS